MLLNGKLYIWGLELGMNEVTLYIYVCLVYVIVLEISTVCGGKY